VVRPSESPLIHRFFGRKIEIGLAAHEVDGNAAEVSHGPAFVAAWHATAKLICGQRVLALLNRPGIIERPLNESFAIHGWSFVAATFRHRENVSNFSRGVL